MRTCALLRRWTCGHVRPPVYCFFQSNLQNCYLSSYITHVESEQFPPGCNSIHRPLLILTSFNTAPSTKKKKKSLPPRRSLRLLQRPPACPVPTLSRPQPESRRRQSRPAAPRRPDQPPEGPHSAKPPTSAAGDVTQCRTSAARCH